MRRPRPGRALTAAGDAGHEGASPPSRRPASSAGFCRKSDFGTSYVRKNMHRKVQVYRCRRKECGRRFTHDDVVGMPDADFDLLSGVMGVRHQ